jgi:hypothetical protein
MAALRPMPRGFPLVGIDYVRPASQYQSKIIIKNAQSATTIQNF